MAGLARLVTESRRLRAVAIPAYRLYARAMVFNPGPRVLATSMPKAGTHLLSSLLGNFPRLMFSGRHHAMRNFKTPDSPDRGPHQPRQIEWDEVRKALAAVNKGQYMTAHFAPSPELSDLLAELGYRTVAILRDPRDVVVSSTFYLSHLERHFLHRRFTTELTSFGDRLMAVIRGLPPDNSGRGLPSVGRRIQRYMGWAEEPSTYLCRFERLVGPNGGGSEADQIAEIEAVGAHIGRPLGVGDAAQLAAKTWSTSSTTFRKGAIGDWRNHFEERHVLAFKEVAGEGLIELGYEGDCDW